MTAGLAVVGTGPGTGKSCYAVGLLRLWRDRGHRVQPFKAVAVVDPDDPTSTDPDRSARALHHHRVAAGVDRLWWHNPVTVVPDADRAYGTVYVAGEPAGRAALPAEDLVALEDFAPELRARCERAVLDAVKVLLDCGAVPVIEGAGAVGQHDPDLDLANRIPLVAAGLPVLMVVRGTGPDAEQALLDGLLGLDEQLRELVIGFAVNGVRDAADAAALTERVSARTGLPGLGWTPDGVTRPPYGLTRADQDRRHDAWAAAVEAGLRITQP